MPENIIVNVEINIKNFARIQGLLASMKMVTKMFCMGRSRYTLEQVMLPARVRV